MYKKVLVPYDKSDPSRRALAQALDLVACAPDAEVTVLSVVDWRDFNAETFKIASRMSGAVGSVADSAAFADVGLEAAREESERVMEDIAGIPGCADSLGDGGRVSIAVVNGSPHDAITAYADEGGYDCIVMGHRGMGAMRGVLGSVCYSTLHKTNCPVLVVK